MMMTSASSSSSDRSLAVAAVPHDVPQRRRELLHLAHPVRDHARRGDDERLERLPPLGLRVLCLHGEEERERLHGLAEPHVVGEDAARADLVEEPEPVEPLLLVGAERRLEVPRLLRPLDLVDVAELLEQLLRAVRHVRLAHLLEQLLDSSRLRERELAPLPSPRREDLGLAEEHVAHLLRVESRERPVREAHVAAPFGEALRELVLRDRRPLRSRTTAGERASRRRSRRARSRSARRRARARRRGRRGRRGPTPRGAGRSPRSRTGWRRRRGR